ncbi:MAG: Fe-S cluster assembly protein SufD [bacterium]
MNQLSTTTGSTDSACYIDEHVPVLQQGPQWLQKQRRIFREAFNNLPLPRRGLHFWRYSDPGKFLISGDMLSKKTPSTEPAAIERAALAGLEPANLCGVVTDTGGREIKLHGLAEEMPPGMIVSSLSDAVDRHSDLVESYLYRLVNGQTAKFEALNSALFNDGILIYVPDGVTVEKPLHLLRLAGQAGSVHFPRLLVVVGRNAELTLVDEYDGGSPDITDGISHVNSAVEIFGLEQSRIRYVSLQRHLSGNVTYMTCRARVERGADILTVPLVFGSSLAKQNFDVILDGETAQSDIFGLLFGSGHQHLDNHTRQHHAAARTNSHIDFKVVLRDRAVSAYTGLIRIDQTSPSCEAYQENRNLMLNDGTRVETIPELEILNEDVQCSHGATTGSIDEMMRFYLNSRGIPPTEAMRMIVSGFVETTLQRIPEDLQARIRGYVAERLENL